MGVHINKARGHGKSLTIDFSASSQAKTFIDRDYPSTINRNICMGRLVAQPVEDQAGSEDSIDDAAHVLSPAEAAVAW